MDADSSSSPLPPRHAAQALADELSTAVASRLERLTPQARVAFLLHTVFGASLDEVAQVVGCSALQCRVLVARAAAQVRGGEEARPPTFPHQPTQE